MFCIFYELQKGEFWQSTLENGDEELLMASTPLLRWFGAKLIYSCSSFDLLLQLIGDVHQQSETSGDHKKAHINLFVIKRNEHKSYTAIKVD